MVFSKCFFRSFLAGPFSGFVTVLWGFEGLEVIFGLILDKLEVFGEKVGPSFLHTFTAFWLDFQGPGPPGESKKREQTASESWSFFELKKRAPKTVFSDFRLHFEVIFSALFGDFGHVGAAYFRERVRDCFGTLFGSILEVFWTVFGSIFGIILEVLLMKNVVLPARELNFQTVLCCSRFFVCWRASRK